MPEIDGSEGMPLAMHPGELYRIEFEYAEEDSPAIVVLDSDDGDPVWNTLLLIPGPHPAPWVPVLRRLVHCRNLVDGPEGYVERCEGVERFGLDADIAALHADFDERLAQRIAKHFEGWLDRLGLLEQARGMFNMCPSCGFLSSGKPARYVSGVPCPSCGQTHEHHHAFRRSLLILCCEEIARWAEPPLQDAPSTRPDASLSREDARRGGE